MRPTCGKVRLGEGEPLSYLFYIGLPKAPFDIGPLFPKSITFTDETDSALGQAVLGSSRQGKTFCVTQFGCSTNVLGKAHRRLNCDDLIRDSLRQLEQSHGKLYFLVHWAADPVDPKALAERTRECTLAEFLAAFPGIETDTWYVVFTSRYGAGWKP